MGRHSHNCIVHFSSMVRLCNLFHLCQDHGRDLDLLKVELLCNGLVDDTQNIQASDETSS